MTTKLRAGSIDEDGFTLVELLIAIVILGTATVALVTGMTTLVLATTHHRGQSQVDAVVRAYSEAVKQHALKLAAPVSSYECPTAADLQPTAAEYTPPSGYTATFTQSNVDYWIPSAADPRTGTWNTDRSACTAYYAAHCPVDSNPDCDPGLIRILVTAKSDNAVDRGAQTTSQVLVRKGNP